MAIKVNPNRMELLKLKKRTLVAKRGHKLLKDKFDELMKRFLVLVNKNKDLRNQLEEKLASAYRNFIIVYSEAPMNIIEEAISCLSVKLEVDVKTTNIVGVNIPELEIKRDDSSIDSYDLMTTPAMLDIAIDSFNQILPLMFELAEAETSLKLLAGEIEKTRRRVNALEYILIPQLEEAARFVTMKLDEMERSSFVRLMKIKSIVG